MKFNKVGVTVLLLLFSHVFTAQGKKNKIDIYLNE